MDQEQDTSLLERFAAMPDPRQARGKRYSWRLILTLIAAALVSGAQGVRALRQWISERQPELLALLGGARQRLPGATTVRRPLRVVDVADLEARARARGGPLAPARPAAAAPPALVGVARDGKQGNGANARGARVQLLRLTRHADACVLRHCAVAAKTNAIPTAPHLLAGLDLTNVVVTMDALLTQHAIATPIRQQHGPDLLVVKDHQPTLAADSARAFDGTCPVLPSDHLATTTTVDQRHGRLETRTLARTAARNASLTWPAVGPVLRRTGQSVIRKTGLIRPAVSDAVTSLPAASTTPAQREARWRGH